jgi:methyl-accepting chemotaxis protein
LGYTCIGRQNSTFNGRHISRHGWNCKIKKEILKHIESSSAVAQENSAVSEQVAASSQELSASSEKVALTAENLSNIALNLKETVGKFNI